MFETLTIISNDHDVAMGRAQEAHEFGLEPCRVLVFVDENRVILTAQIGGGVCLFHEESVCEQEEIIVVKALLGPFRVVEEPMQGHNGAGVWAVLWKGFFQRVCDGGHVVGRVTKE